MGTWNVAGLDAALPAATRGGQRSLPRRMRERVESFLSSGSLSYDRTFLFVRPAIALLVVAAVFVQGSHLPGRDGVLFACMLAILYNFFFAVLVAKRRIFLLHASGLIFDNATVLAASAHVFHRMGLVGYESDLWLIFLVLIVTNSMYYGPIGSLVFALLWTGWFTGISLLFYHHGTYFRTALPTRLVFFGLTTFVSLSLCDELRRRRRKLEHQTRQTLTMLATIVEARDSDAGLHLRHIQHYSRALALHLGLSDLDASEIAYAAMIHDVGKAQVSDAVLKKPGPLTLDERREMQQHSLWGDQLLSENEEFATARQVARSHHERWDGGGYPDGLAGVDIPLSARIVAVADVYDALISERPYKHAWPPQDAIAEIRRLRGEHLDPNVVDAFLELYEGGILADLEAEMHDSPDHVAVAA